MSVLTTRICRTLVLLCVLSALGASPAFSAVRFENGSLVYSDGGTAEVFPAATLWTGAVVGADLVFAGLDAEQAARVGRGPVIFFFDASGKPVGSVESSAFFDAERCSAVSASPDGTVLAFDNGTWLVRRWVFMTWPDFTVLGEPLSYLADEGGLDLAWLDSRTVLVTALDTSVAGERRCEYDPCGSKSVILHHVGGVSDVLFGGDSVCDYTLLDVSRTTLTLLKACTREAADWSDLEGLEGKVIRQVLQEELPVR